MGIRKCTRSDIEPIFSLLKELDEALDEDQDISIESIYHQYDEMIMQPEIYENYIYEDSSIVIGFISLLNYRSFYHKNGTTQINELVVNSKYRNKGIGKELLDFAIKKAKDNGMDEIEVGVMKDNYKAIEFYKKNGISDEYLILGKEF
ncbi:MAG: aminoalkylphosphonic acid N-acetyltransferase [Candidatus Methanofastidiosum methylothiophilum]|jgi:ribosomal protein S18 acetylase RimI-like enzyme|uniref:Aminoalkylphosphonic acid N-acetyltransferase n=1 Tax=Candidatus Methanofastidiosum methylothiophilum TaxID=1705564 RepID=A0A150IV69_9EURY|nr:MAG: aminoalkylphosphonic acid N-acetyltransferase [Candidatus Methanofastidiosum methylthiophilus]